MRHACNFFCEPGKIISTNKNPEQTLIDAVVTIVREHYFNPLERQFYPRSLLSTQFYLKCTVILMLLGMILNAMLTQIESTNKTALRIATGTEGGVCFLATLLSLGLTIRSYQQIQKATISSSNSPWLQQLGKLLAFVNLMKAEDAAEIKFPDAKFDSYRVVDIMKMINTMIDVLKTSTMDRTKLTDFQTSINTSEVTSHQQLNFAINSFLTVPLNDDASIPLLSVEYKGYSS